MGWETSGAGMGWDGKLLVPGWDGVLHVIKIAGMVIELSEGRHSTYSDGICRDVKLCDGH